jgi:hypothetical protein
MKLYDLLYDYLNIIDMMTQVGPGIYGFDKQRSEKHNLILEELKISIPNIIESRLKITFFKFRSNN